ncbi:MAG: SUMF1/EgtB/PvdO family nonheme iron enzyme [Treponema sp.]|jgi:formylglycine-generating enzyme required for sulfatase activity|nr:SUMF1/EgtB/PvdO family nonheme iron enzyme [Treponema sp.]
MKRNYSRGVKALSPFIFIAGLALLFSSCPQEPEMSRGSPPPAPEGIAAESGNGKLYISWRPAAGAEEYAVYWSEAETPPAEPYSTTSGLTAVISGLTNGQEYTVWVKALNSAGESGFSLPPVKGTPVAPELPQQYRDFAPVPGGTVTGSGSYAFTVTVPTVPPGYTNAGTTSTRKGVFVEGRAVTIGAFAMAKYETTQALWFAVQVWSHERGYQFQNPKAQAPAEAQKNLPVAGISWRDAIVWCNAYSEMAEREPVYRDKNGAVLKDARDAAACDGAVMDKTKSGYRLPTEAEREFAARGGDPGQSEWMFMYAGSNTADDVAWHHGNSPAQIKAVGGKNPNRLDIYDLSGNVQEWCWDWMNYAVEVTAATPVDGAAYSGTSPLANQKAFNGGGVQSNVTMSCVTYRWGFTPNYTDNYVGFRMVRKP